MFTSSPRLCGQLLLALAFLGPAAALAVDGAIEINHARIMAGGVTPGDAPGYPATIAGPGHYVLTGHIKPPNQNTSGIVINAADVHVDLNGFSIVCPSPACASLTAGSGNGIEAIGPNISVENGSIFYMGNSALALQGERNRVKNLQIMLNGSGLVAGRETVVSEVQSNGNRQTGISVGVGSNVSRSVITRNGGAGLIAGESSVIQSNTIVDNQAGVQGGHSTLVVENVIRSGMNSSAGAALSCVGCSVVDNSLYGKFPYTAVDAATFSGNRITAHCGSGSGNMYDVASTGINYCNGYVNFPTGEVVEWGQPVSYVQPIHCCAHEEF